MNRYPSMQWQFLELRWPLAFLSRWTVGVGAGPAHRASGMEEGCIWWVQVSLISQLLSGNIHGTADTHVHIFAASHMFSGVPCHSIVTETSEVGVFIPYYRGETWSFGRPHIPKVLQSRDEGEASKLHHPFRPGPEHPSAQARLPFEGWTLWAPLS